MQKRTFLPIKFLAQRSITFPSPVPESTNEERSSPTVRFLKIFSVSAAMRNSDCKIENFNFRHTDDFSVHSEFGAKVDDSLMTSFGD